METKKSKRANIDRRRFIYLQIGLVVAVALTLAAFEWVSADERTNYAEIEADEEASIPWDQFEEDKPVEEEEPQDEPKDEPEDDQDDSSPDDEDQETSTNNVIDDADETKDKDEQSDGIADAGLLNDLGAGKKIVKKKKVLNDTIVDWIAISDPPTAPYNVLEFLGKHIKYPQRARHGSIQGTVFIEFVVSTDGSIQDARIKKGIGGGCDEEALRVINLMPKWVPGEMAGNKVKVRYIQPVKYVLN